MSGLIVYTPAQGDQCWDSPVPSTPYFNPNLRLRVAGKIESGFTVNEKPDVAAKGATLNGDSPASNSRD
ncbi:MAG: hypothetical protein ACP5VS_16345 [Desulfomonilaceae bacterium]